MAMNNMNECRGRLWYSKTDYEHELRIGLDPLRVSDLLNTGPYSGLTVFGRETCSVDDSNHSAPSPVKEIDSDPAIGLYRKYILGVRDLHISPSSLIPPWLSSDRFVDHWQLLERTLTLMPALDLAGNLPVLCGASHDKTDRDESDFAGEHFRHPASVLAVGDHLLDTKIPNGGVETPLWSAMAEWCAKDLGCGEENDSPEEVMGCPGALKQHCMHFLWQLTALLHDVGYHNAFLHCVASMLTSKDGCTYPMDFALPRKAIEKIHSTISFDVACAKFLDLCQAGVYGDGTVKKRLIDYVADCKAKADEDAKEASKGHRVVSMKRGDPYYPWYGHAIYGALLIEEYEKSINVHEQMGCTKHILRWLKRAIATHHVPLKTPKVDQSEQAQAPAAFWRFNDHPLAYLLKVVDEIPLLASWREMPPVEFPIDHTNGTDVKLRIRENPVKLCAGSKGELVIMCCRGPKPKKNGNGDSEMPPDCNCKLELDKQNPDMSRKCDYNKARAALQCTLSELSQDTSFPVQFWPIRKDSDG